MSYPHGCSELDWGCGVATDCVVVLVVVVLAHAAKQIFSKPARMRLVMSRLTITPSLSGREPVCRRCAHEQPRAYEVTGQVPGSRGFEQPQTTLGGFKSSDGVAPTSNGQQSIIERCQHSIINGVDVTGSRRRRANG